MSGELEGLLRNLDGSSEVQCTALERLRRLAKQTDEKREEIVAAGLLEKLKGLLQQDDVKVKERAVVLLVYLGKAERNRDVVRESGCLDVLCRELKSPHSVVLHNCMAALVNLTIANAENQTLMRENGSMRLVVDLMREESAKTRQNACWLLKKLATNNQKNRDALREMGALENLVPLLSPEQKAEVQEHAVALLAFLLDKHTRNRMHFKDIAGGPAALTSLNDSVLGSGSKTEEFCGKCIESLGGVRKMADDKRGSSSSRKTHSAHSQNSMDEKSPRSLLSETTPRKMEPSPRRFLSPRGLRGGGDEKREKKSIFGRKKEKEKEKEMAKGNEGSKWVQGDDDDPIMKPGGGGRQSMDEEELADHF